MEKEHETNPEPSATPENEKAPPFEVRDTVRVKKSEDLVKVINRPDNQLYFGKFPREVLSIKWLKDPSKKCWAITLSGCKEGDMYYAKDFELAPPEAKKTDPDHFFQYKGNIEK